MGGEGKVKTMEASRRGTELPLSEDPQLGTTTPNFS